MKERESETSDFKTLLQKDRGFRQCLFFQLSFIQIDNNTLIKCVRERERERDKRKKKKKKEEQKACGNLKTIQR